MVVWVLEGRVRNYVWGQRRSFGTGELKLRFLGRGAAPCTPHLLPQVLPKLMYTEKVMPVSLVVRRYEHRNASIQKEAFARIDHISLHPMIDPMVPRVIEYRKTPAKKCLMISVACIQHATPNTQVILLCMLRSILAMGIGP